MKRARNSSLRVVAAVLALAATIAVGCRQKAAPGSVDFARSNSVSVVLGDPAAEHGNGVEHAYWEKDGLTAAVNLDGVQCRSLKLEGTEIGYLYFLIDPTFKKGGVKHVRIEVEYFDERSGEMGLQFDATRSRRVSSSAYTESGQIVRLQGSKTWETGRFYIEDASFRNSQNSRADFRLWVRPPELSIRRISITRVKK